MLQEERKYIDETCYIRMFSDAEIVSVDGQIHVPLSPTEYAVISFFLENANRPVRLEDLAEHIWGINYEADGLDPESLKSTITRIRKKLAQVREGLRASLKTNYGFGSYTFVVSYNGKSNSAENEKTSGVRENNKSYTQVLPESIIKENEKIITELFWSRYEYLSAQKEGENKNSEIIAKIGDVYQLPLIQKNGNDCKWSIERRDCFNPNILIEAPNGYGKSTFLKSILLASTYLFRDCLSEKEKEHYEAIKKYHGIDDSSLILYLECKDIELVNPDTSESAVKWIYDSLSNMQSIQLDKYIDIDSFLGLIRDYNLCKKLILLIDGLDEIAPDCRTILINRLYNFQRDKEFGQHSRIIMTTRPLFWQIESNGYCRYTISNRNIIEDKNVFLNYISSYIGERRSIDAEEVYTYITNYPYLMDLACTPAIIVWIIREYLGNSELYETVERVIEQMMLRYNSRELTVDKHQYKRVYEELANRCLMKEDSSLPYLNSEVLSLVRGCIEKILGEGDRHFNRVFSDDNKKDEDLGELFFTNVALMEYQNDRIRFTSLTYAYHLAARHILRLFSKEKSATRVFQALDALSIKYRYSVMVVASALVLHLQMDITHFQGFGSDSEIPYFLAEVFYNYFQKKWMNQECSAEEKMLIQDAIAQILLNYYGENVYTNRNMIKEETGKYVKGLMNIVNIDLENSSATVDRARKEMR